MKKEFLKIAGVKSEKQFYAKYPTESAFFKSHPEAKKLIKKAQVGDLLSKPPGEGYSWDPYMNQWVEGGMDYSQTQSKGTPAVGAMNNVGQMVGGLSSGGGAASTSVASATNKSATNKTGNFLDKIGGVQGAIGSIGGIVSGIREVGAAKKRTKKLESLAKISDLQVQAANTTFEPIRKKRSGPELYKNRPNEIFPSQGTGYDPGFAAKNGTVLKAQEGMQIGGNLTEIQNMYNPGDLYSNLGYEPLQESDVVKQYQEGGDLKMFGLLGGPSATTPGVGGMTGMDFGSLGTGIFNAAMGESAESNLGGSIGSLFGPAGTMVGTMAGKILGANREGREANAKAKMKSNIERVAGMNFGQDLQRQYTSFVRNGGEIPYAEYGWVSHDWQPQVITKFGEHDVRDLLRPDETMDTLRTGGNIRQNNMSSLDEFALGGTVKTHWGGYAEPLSHNPYLPGNGETVMFRGQSHDESDGKGRTGIGVSYGEPTHDSYTDYAEYGTEAAEKQAQVEVEEGEPATQDGQSMTVYGALRADLTGDKDAEGKTFKKYVSDLSYEEEKQNKKIAKATEELSDLKPISSFDKLKMSSLQSMLMGADMKLKDIADKKLTAASVQNALNETAEQRGLDANALAKGKLKLSKEGKEMAKYGKELEKAQVGIKAKESINKLSDFLREKGLNLSEKIAEINPFKNVKFLNPSKDSQDSPPSKIKELKEIVITPSKEYMEARKKKKAATTSGIEGVGRPTFNLPNPLAGLKNLTGSKRKSSKKSTTTPTTTSAPSLKLQKSEIVPDIVDIEDVSKTSIPAPKEPVRPTAKVKKSREKTDLGNLAKIVIPQIANLLRKPLQEDLDIRQLYPEMLAKSQNVLQPVRAQLYQPLLEQPYQVSFQDQLNQNQATFNALQRQVGNNPAAVSQLAAQKYEADRNILANQFRTNQGMIAETINKNRGTLNDAQLKNLAILDQQYTRQAEALSKTKATDLEISKSISDKIARNQLENRTFAAYSNMFPQYGFRRDMMAYSQSPTFFNTGQVPGLSPEDAKEFQEWYDQKLKKKAEEKNTTPAKYGKELKKHFKNGNIVKSFKG